ncbi:uncharacterized protein LOC113314049 isoform X1 [Papaver somniferum]|uniref:uncharacterized protein LOC113314049 isoform X1 n=1 Tax=Papaver somniferum TaxID=3469 RepID=UPI000E7008F9|nr:uncharacterized protein LOC113314049 isoform X1 [Papaver somniferum]XP_026418609.1 uncharacterized protein LOC113314049 isoform X1 [Papaver somniferum]
MWTMLRHSLLFVYGSLPAHGGIFTWMMLMPISYQDQWHLDVADCWDIHCFHLRSPLLLVFPRGNNLNSFLFQACLYIPPCFFFRQIVRVMIMSCCCFCFSIELLHWDPLHEESGTLFCLFTDLCQHMEAYLTGMTLMPILMQSRSGVVSSGSSDDPPAVATVILAWPLFL